MATSSRQHLPPCCHGILLSKKDTTKVRFKSELAKFAVPNAKKDALPRLAAALTDARSALQLDRTGAVSGSGSSTTASRFNTMDDLQSYITAVAEYLSLVKGFTVTPASLVSHAQPPLLATGATASEQLNPVATLSAEGSFMPQAAALREPLIDSTTATTTTTASTTMDMQTSRSKCLGGVCNWRDVLSNTTAYAPNARLEMAQTLLASGLHMMHDARVRVDTMLAERLTEIPESELKIAYQLLLHAAGVFDACLVVLERTPQPIPSSSNQQEPLADKSGGDTPPSDDADAMEKWRQEQRRATQQPSAPAASPDELLAQPTAPKSTTDDFAMLSRIPDLANGRFPQLLAWISLAQAQELVILRGISRDFVDYALLAKLAIDVALRYRACQAFASKHLRSVAAVSQVPDKIQLYCGFKDAYYAAVSSYFQGAACMEKEDAIHCAQAIANFKHASKLIQESNQRKAAFDARALALHKQEESERMFSIKTVYMRAEQIIQRDLEIVTRRNDAIYYERIPEPEPVCEPMSLVRAVEFPSVEIHALWHDADVNTCLQATQGRTAPASSSAGVSGGNGAGGTGTTTAANSAGHTQEAGGPRRDAGCCESCVIS